MIARGTADKRGITKGQAAWTGKTVDPAAKKGAESAVNRFKAAIETLAHETAHWTAHESRQPRDFDTRRFGSEGYAIEELVAELGAAFLCADLDLTLEPREDHGVANWLDLLTADNRAIFAAASHAQRAADFINGLQPASGD